MVAAKLEHIARRHSVNNDVSLAEASRDGSESRMIAQRERHAGFRIRDVSVSADHDVFRIDPGCSVQQEAGEDAESVQVRPEVRGPGKMMNGWVCGCRSSTNARVVGEDEASRRR